MQDSLRRRFGSALQWYHALQDATNKHVDNILTHVQRITVGIDDGLLKDATPDSDFPTLSTSTPMRTAPIAISNPDPHTADDETHDHEFLFCSRVPSVTPELQDRSVPSVLVENFLVSHLQGKFVLRAIVTDYHLLMQYS